MARARSADPLSGLLASSVSLQFGFCLMLLATLLTLVAAFLTWQRAPARVGFRELNQAARKRSPPFSRRIRRGVPPPPAGASAPH